MANIVITNTTASSVTAYVAGLDASYSRNDRYVSWNAVDGSIPVSDASGTSYLDAYVSQGGEITLSGLRSNIQYTLQAVVYYTNGGVWESVTLFAGFTTGSGGGGSRPALFYWNSYGASPTSSTTTIFLPKATALNGLSTNIREVQAYKGYSQTPFFGVLPGDNIVEIINMQAGAINALNGWDYLTIMPADRAPSSNYILSMQTYINMVT